MGSGMYGAVSGLIGRMQMMDNISEQLSAVKDNSYKKSVPTFEAELAEANSGMASKGVNYTRVSEGAIDFSPGQMEYTGDPLNVAINGDGFFQVQQADGSFGYTRKGNFKLDSEGTLIDSEGRKLMSAGGGPITLPSSEVDISQDGNIWYQEEQIAKIGVFQFTDNSILQRAQGGMFLPSDGSQPNPLADPQLAQKNLESSNVNMMQTMVQMTANLRTFEAIQKALTAYNNMDLKAVDLGLVQ